MSTLTEFWDPNEWELYVYMLLQDRHGATNVMKVPARHKGDHGIDYYCLSDRIAYQCYAVEEPCVVSDRAEKQNAKITRDLKKLKTNASDIGKMFGNIKIDRWALVVPLHDSTDVNKHLTKKTAEVKAWSLSFVASTFEAIIQDIQAFDAASVIARALQRKTIALPDKRPSQQQVVEWTAASDALVVRLTGKIRKRAATGVVDSEIDELVNKAVEWFLERENTLENLRDVAPQLYETLSGVIARHTERLRLLGPPQVGVAREILRTEIDALKADIKASVPNFSDKNADLLALGTVADWLMRCPLDFPPYAHV